MREEPRKIGKEARRRRVVMVAYANAQMLDVTGPLEVFAAATRALEDEGGADPGYSVEIAAVEKGPLRMSSGLSLVAQRALQRVRGPIDILMVAGGRVLARH